MRSGATSRLDLNGGGKMEKQIGRPTGWRKPEGVRKQRQLRAYDDEWKLIQRFEKMVKHGDKQTAIDFLDKHAPQSE